MSLQAEVMKQQDLATRAIINAEENERKRIAADLHDGVGQMMSAAKMNLSAFESEISFKDEAQKISFENLISLVDESCKEIRSVSHQMMPNALLKSGLASAVKEFLDKIDNRIIKISLHAEGLQQRLDSNTETVLYRVIQECVNNVIKHSGANKLDISLIKDADGISVTVEDNGHGFDTADKKKFEGIGLKNINSRVTFLKGTVDFDSSPGKGTLVAIHVPAGADA
jgi:signal transduction histidine kinase